MGAALSTLHCFHVLPSGKPVNRCLTLVLVAVSMTAQPAIAAEPSRELAPALRDVHTFAFALGSGDLANGATLRKLAAYDLVVVDGEEVPASRVRALRARGTVVLAYLSVGTIEPGRSWYRAAKPYRLPDRFEEFDEDYAATSKPGYRRLIRRRVAPAMLRKGFDGLFLDNTDMIENHRAQTRGMRILVRELASLTHGAKRPRLLFSQNGDRVIGPSLRYYDGWNREDVTSTYNFDKKRYERVSAADTRAAQRTMRGIHARGILVTSADYTKRGDSSTDTEALRHSCETGALPFIGNIGLTRLPPQPVRCP